MLTHKDFEGWQFCQKQDDREFNYVNERKPFVCFASFQDVLGKNAVGGIKATNEWIQTVNWDCIVLDEYHYGAWGKNAKNFYDKKDPALKRAEEMGYHDGYKYPHDFPGHFTPQQYLPDALVTEHLWHGQHSPAEEKLLERMINYWGERYKK